MTTENSMTLAPAATLTERELWARYLPLTITQTMNFGPTVERFVPDNQLRDPGSFGLIEDLGDALANNVEESETPEETLDLWIDDLESYVNGLKIVRDSFRRLKKVNQIVPPDHALDATEDEIREWERAAIKADETPRYREPVITPAEAA